MTATRTTTKRQGRAAEVPNADPTLRELQAWINRSATLQPELASKELVKLAHHFHPKVRFYAVKNLARLKNPELCTFYRDIITTDKASEVRREAVAALGRIRTPAIIPLLLKCLQDHDPAIVGQAIRGLLPFLDQANVHQCILDLGEHPNEMVRELVANLNNKKRATRSSEETEPRFPQFMQDTTVCGDVLKIITPLPDACIHLTFTSPPYYNARDYTTYNSYAQYLTLLETVFKQVHRITKEGRFFVLNTSPIIIPRIGRSYASKRYPIPYDLHPRLVTMGWEFIDDIVWVKPEASVKNRNAGFWQHRKPLAYKTNARTEMIMVYRKKTAKLIDWNIKQYADEVVEASRVRGDYETSNIWSIDPCFDKTHSAVFPLELCRRVIQFYSYQGDLVFDPFAGSGTLGEAALGLGRHFFLTEKDPTYFRHMQKRLSRQASYAPSSPGLNTERSPLEEDGPSLEIDSNASA